MSSSTYNITITQILPPLSQGLREQIAIKGQQEKERRYGASQERKREKRNSTLAYQSAKLDRENWMAYFTADVGKREITPAPTRTMLQRSATVGVAPPPPPPPKTPDHATLMNSRYGPQSQSSATRIRIPERSHTIHTGSAARMPLVRRPTLPSSPASTRSPPSSIKEEAREERTQSEGAGIPTYSAQSAAQAARSESFRRRYYSSK